MIKYVCDMCGKELDENGLVYDLSIELKAKYKKLEINLKDLLVDHMQEIREIIEKNKDVTPDKLQHDVYKKLSFHLCYECHQRYLNNPLGQRGPIDKRLFGEN